MNPTDKSHPNGHERYYRLGKTYWWFYGKYLLVLGLLRQTIPPPGNRPLRIYDAGCGPGHFMEQLADWGEVVGTDYSHERLVYAHREGHERLAQSDLRRIPFLDNSFDLITTIDTVEHIDDDRQALRELQRVLRPGGIIAVTVPAFMLLWGTHDVVQGHYRRYRTAQMRQLLEETGFRVLKISYAEMLWFPPLLVLRKLKNLFLRVKPTAPTDDFMFLPDGLNRLLTRVITSELPLLKRMNLPFGVTMLCIAAKPEPPASDNGKQQDS